MSVSIPKSSQSTPDQRGDRPSRHGRLLGDLLSRLAAAGAAARGDEILAFMCSTCAFRAGSLPNASAGTALTAFNCAARIDPDPFCCHHGMKDGEPQRLCAGYVAAQSAPFEFLKAETARLHEALGFIDDISGDDVRDAFDSWADQIDPDNKLDVYELARRWAIHTNRSPS